MRLVRLELRHSIRNEWLEYAWYRGAYPIIDQYIGRSIEGGLNKIKHAENRLVVITFERVMVNRVRKTSTLSIGRLKCFRVFITQDDCGSEANKVVRNRPSE